MQWILNKLKSSFVFRVSFIYAVFAWFVIESVIFAISRAVIPEAALITVAILSIGYFPIVLQVSRAMEAVRPLDRSLFFKQIAWVYGPVFLLYGPLTLLLG